MIRAKILVGVGVAAVLIVGFFLLSPRGQVTPILSGSYEYKLLKINGESTRIREDGITLWTSWANGNITVQEYTNQSKVLLARLDGLIAQMNSMNVSAQWEEAYSNYKSYLLAMKDAFTIMPQFAVEVGAGRLSPAEEAYALRQIDGIQKEADQYFQSSWSSWPLPHGNLLPAAFSPIPQNPLAPT